VAKGPKIVADSLVSHGVINDEVYELVNLDSKTSTDKARELAQAVKASVKINHKMFSTFLVVLSEHSITELVKSLKDKCK